MTTSPRNLDPTATINGVHTYRLEPTGKAPIVFEGRCFSRTRSSIRSSYPRYSTHYRVRIFVSKQNKVVLECVRVVEDRRSCFVSVHNTLEESVDNLLLVPFVSNRLYNMVVDDLLKRKSGGNASI